MIIMNERKYIENITKEDFCKKLRYNITLLTRKYLEDGISEKEVVPLVIDYLKNNLDDFIEEKWIGFIESVISRHKGEKLKCVNIIPITKSEIRYVRTLDTRNEKFLLFTLIVLAKFRNMVVPNNNNWVSYSISDIFKVMGVNINKENQDLTLNSLYKVGLIEYATRNDCLSIRVPCISDDEDVAIGVTSLEKVGYVYSDYEKLLNGYKRCEDCGKTYKPKNNNHKYCGTCARKIEKQKTKERVRKLRKSRNVTV